MSQQITEAFVEAFGSNFLHVAQQKTSRFESAVMVEPSITGSSKSINRLGRRAAQRRLNRHGDTPLNDQPHSTRFVDLFDWEDGDMLDDQDKIRMLVDPKSDYVAAMVAGLNRAKDDVIVSALNGTARTTTGTSSLPAGQIIVNGSTALTKAKIIQARQIFRGNEADDLAGEELYWAYGNQQMRDILNDTQLTSADYLAVQMLQSGNVAQKWMGFTWVPFENLPKSSTIRSNIAWAKSGVCLGIGENITTKIGEDPGKGFNVRVYAKMSIGAVRVEEEKVVRIDCVET
jgi:hypothetical protein